MPQDSYSKILEEVTTDSQYEVKRLKVPGGFLMFARDVSITPSQFQMRFVPSPDADFIMETIQQIHPSLFIEGRVHDIADHLVDRALFDPYRSDGVGIKEVVGQLP